MIDLETCPEIILYFFIDQCGEFVWRMNHDMADGRIPQKDHAAIDQDILKIQKQQQEAVQHLPRFGIAKPTEENGAPTSDYWQWYRAWDGWKKGMTNAEWQEVDTALSRGLTEDELVKFRPKNITITPINELPY